MATPVILSYLSVAVPMLYTKGLEFETTFIKRLVYAVPPPSSLALVKPAQNIHEL